MKINNKTIYSELIHLNIHSLICIISIKTIPSVKKYLNKSMGGFISHDNFNKNEADIILEPITLDHPLIKKIISLKRGQDKLFIKHEGKTIVYFFYRNNIDYIIVFGSQIQLLYLSSKDIHKRLDGIMKFCIRLQLAKKDSLICHGAVLTKDDHCVLVIGASMIGKTMTTLFLLSSGWNYIADDKFILANNKAYLWEDTIAMRPHYHFKFFPDLKNNIPSYSKVIRKFVIMERLLKMARQYVPRQLLPFVEEFSTFRLYYKIKIDSLFPTSNVINSAKLTDILVFSLSNNIKFEKSCLKETINEISIIQKILFRDLLLFEKLLCLSDESLVVDYKKILSNNLKHAQFYRFTTTINVDFKQFSKMLNDFLISLKT